MTQICTMTKPLDYAADGKCHNAELGTWGHECGKQATWIGLTQTGFRSGFCDHCKKDGHEASRVVQWSVFKREAAAVLTN